MRRCLVLLVLLLALPVHLTAQARPRLSPVVGVSLGTTRLPDALVWSHNGVATLPTLAGQAGLVLGPWTAALHGSVFAALIVADHTPPIPHDPTSSGIRASRYYPEFSGSGDRSLSLQLAYGPVSSFWSAGVGAGRLFDARAPYGLAKMGLHTRGRVRARADVEHWVVRVRYEDVETEWANGRTVRRTSLGSGHEWPSALALRLGVEVR